MQFLEIMYIVERAWHAFENVLVRNIWLRLMDVIAIVSVEYLELL